MAGVLLRGNVAVMGESVVKFLKVYGVPSSSVVV